DPRGLFAVWYGFRYGWGDGVLIRGSVALVGSWLEEGFWSHTFYRRCGLAGQSASGLLVEA
ncbi:MAG: hypothetical protein KDC71_23205, partial [Acidobacteria bacterium]|nr:hypothetical protein [Acidobacteriota bacterium]